MGDILPSDRDRERHYHEVMEWNGYIIRTFIAPWLAMQLPKPIIIKADGTMDFSLWVTAADAPAWMLGLLRDF